MLGYRKKLGAWGEELARRFYEEQGYSFITANWRKRFAEVDLIFKIKTDLVFVEVKTRTSDKFGYGEQSVTWSKKQKISRAMDSFVDENLEYKDYFPRFDILVVELFSLRPEFVHYENVCLHD